MDLIVEGLESRKTGEKYHDHVLNDAINSIKHAQQALDEGLKEPEKWYKDTETNCKIFMKLFPFIYILQQLHNPSKDTEESLLIEPSEDQSISDN
jgi:hypothetical protein